MKNFGNQKGITLVALVITIIVLLILAGVSLSLVLGSTGILGRASRAADENAKATAKEEVALFIADLQTEFYEKVYVTRNDTTATVNTKVGDWIQSKCATDQTTPGDYKFTITGDSSPYTVTIKGPTSNKDEKRLKEDITGKLTDTGKLTWD